MAQPYDNPFSGLNRGLQSGLQLGLQIRQQRVAEQELAQKKQQQAQQEEFNNNIKKATMAMTLIGDQNMPDAIRLKAYNEGLVPSWNTLNPNSGMTNLDALPNHAAEYAKKALKIWNSEDYDINTKQEALSALLAEATTKNEQISIENMQSKLQSQQESGFLGQGLAAQRQMKATQALQTQQAGAYAKEGASTLAQDPAALEYASGERDRLLLAGGTKGKDMAASMAEGDKGPGSLDGVLAGLVNSGKMTLEEAYDYKKKASPSTTVNVDMTTKTKGDLEKDTIVARQAVRNLDEIGKLYKPEFLQYSGQGKAWLQEKGSKIGLGTPTEFLKSRAAWKSQAKTFSNEYRKAITGVAGSEKEFKEILQAIPDPDRDSPAVFESKLEQTKLWAQATDKWLTETREQGLSLSETKSMVSAQPKQKDFDTRYGELEKQGITGDALFQKLHEEGY